MVGRNVKKNSYTTSMTTSSNYNITRNIISREIRHAFQLISHIFNYLGWSSSFLTWVITKTLMIWLKKMAVIKIYSRHWNILKIKSINLYIFSKWVFYLSFRYMLMSLIKQYMRTDCMIKCKIMHRYLNILLFRTL